MSIREKSNIDALPGDVVVSVFGGVEGAYAVFVYAGNEILGTSPTRMLLYRSRMIVQTFDSPDYFNDFVYEVECNPHLSRDITES